jgi:hypothetical protein
VRSGSTERKAGGPERQLPTLQNHRPLSVRLGPGGGGIDYDLVIPEGARFRCGVGYRTLARPREPERTRFIVSISEHGDLQPLGSTEVVFDEENPGRRWSPFEVDLSEYAGRRVTLRLEAIPSRPAKRGGNALWGSPRILVLPVAPRYHSVHAN